MPCLLPIKCSVHAHPLLLFALNSTSNLSCIPRECEEAANAWGCLECYGTQLMHVSPLYSGARNRSHFTYIHIKE